jgi:hypothetical protein
MNEFRFDLKYLLRVILLVGIISVSYILLRKHAQSVLTDDEALDRRQQEKSLSENPEEKEYEIVTLLPADAIPAISTPTFYTANEADSEYAADELVIGVTINGKSKAYSTSFLDSHEIVNDELGGRKIAVTW